MISWGRFQDKATAANQLLPGAYGPEIAGFTLLPMMVGALVLAGIGSWTINKVAKSFA
ncbi:hypothetical protein [Streptococcus sp. DD12]|uniref:hypothetical protein n=1 Tax=Streptococcus sp. DD12 TaxID=1777880 RepID=UPI0007944AF5|nr:hypothetical protein [Streptococcus sp. DD12]KXT75438.1 hypothetical protein STRDD12_01249 [Streptococcus sp. DD12]